MYEIDIARLSRRYIMLYTVKDNQKRIKNIYNGRKRLTDSYLNHPGNINMSEIKREQLENIR